MKWGNPKSVNKDEIKNLQVVLLDRFERLREAQNSNGCERIGVPPSPIQKEY